MGDDVESGGAAGEETKTKNKTKFYLSAMLKINDEKVPIVVQTGDETLIQLTKPAKLGNALDVGKWLHDSWHTDVEVLLVTKDGTPQTPDQVKADKSLLTKHLQAMSIPDTMTETLATLMLTDVWITDLYYKSWKANGESLRAIKMGVKLDFSGGNADSDGLKLLPEISLLDVGIGFTNAPPDYVFPKRNELPVIESVSDDELKELKKNADLQDVAS